MRSGRELSLVALFSAFLALGGCPIADSGLGFPPPTETITGNGIRPADDSGLSSPPINGAFGGDASIDSAEAALQVQFPDCEEPAQGEDWKSEIIQLVNQARRTAGLEPVSYNAVLEAQATQYACEMVQFDFFDHVSPVDGSTLGQRATEFGYDYLVVGENLAAGQATPQQAFTDWMNSPSHRRNILDPRFTELGVGVRTGGTYGVYWVQEFGQPAR